MKRGSSGYSFVCGVKKDAGMTSHDVVNCVRKIFGERRVGHAGTLDPAASGVLIVCVGPATRLVNYLVGHDKRYIARIQFGASTDTDDAQGKIVRTLDVPDCVLDARFAEDYLRGVSGAQKQMPPVYSALKMGGKKACDEARRGNVIELSPRDIKVFEAKLLDVGTENIAHNPYWDVEFHVSSGTYVRALARDIGLGVGSVAHLSALERTCVGALSLHDCASLEVLEREGAKVCIDPVQLLGMRMAFLDDGMASKVDNGGFLPEGLQLCEMGANKLKQNICSCTSGVAISKARPLDVEKIAVVADNKLKAIYFYDAKIRKFKPDCVFSLGVSRGTYL